MQVKVQKQPKATFKLEITIPAESVQKAYKEVVAEVAKNTQITGFRKGAAPVHLVEERANKSDLYGEVINKLLEVFYPQALKENKIAPVSNPKVEIKEFEPTKDFKFDATVAVSPEIIIKEYKKELKKLFENTKTEHKEHDHDVHLNPDNVVKKLVEIAKVEIADLLVDEEVNRMFSRMVQQIQSLGMKVEDYVKGQNKTIDELTKEYRKIAEESLKAEFILSHLIKEEGVDILDSDIDEMINAVGDKSMQQKLSSPIQKIYIKSLLAKNKLLTKLMEEAEGTFGKDKAEDIKNENSAHDEDNEDTISDKISEEEEK